MASRGAAFKRIGAGFACKPGSLEEDSAGWQPRSGVRFEPRVEQNKRAKRVCFAEPVDFAAPTIILWGDFYGRRPKKSPHKIIINISANPTVPMIDVASLHQSSPPWARILRRSRGWRSGYFFAIPVAAPDLSGAKVAPGGTRAAIFSLYLSQRPTLAELRSLQADVGRRLGYACISSRMCGSAASAALRANSTESRASAAWRRRYALRE